uniref:Uncharacterized protein n=1 Tax=Anguilla anguilla TaxID=7936 RepID=A0A0E9U4N2_ANGAN
MGVRFCDDLVCP